MIVDKLARTPDLHRRAMLSFPNARSALGEFLGAAASRPGDLVLLPAYIGWSEREGSGVFDPVQNRGLDFGFYRVDSRLRIDLDDLERALRTRRVKVVLLIHYFGYIDPGYEHVVALARRFGAMIVEDEAHAMLTDLIGGQCGRLCDACVFSFHKLLPVSRGGALVLNHSAAQLPISTGDRETEANPILSYDLPAIARIRRENAFRLHQLLEPLAEHVEPLWGPPGPGEVPQTCPVLIRNVSRDRLYFEMNEAGLGVVSLYHTMIAPIAAAGYAESIKLARTILNLPLHQDLTFEDLERLVEGLAQQLENLTRAFAGV
jgi:dTDP-4-amino-4,6-dideoxygalactose transaminase